MYQHKYYIRLSYTPPSHKQCELLLCLQITYAANVAEGDLADSGAGNKHVAALRGKAAEEGCDVIVVSAQAHPLLTSSVSVSASINAIRHVVCSSPFPSQVLNRANLWVLNP